MVRFVDTGVTPNEAPIQGEGIIPSETGQGVEAFAVHTTPRGGDTPIQVTTPPPNITDQDTPPQEAVGGYTEAVRARGASTLEANRLKATTGFLDAVGSSIKEWDTVAGLEKLIQGVPKGTPDPDFDFYSSLSAVEGLVLGETEREWLASKNPQNQEYFDTLIQDLKDQQELNKIASTYPVSSLITHMLDPVYIIGGGVIGGAARALRAGRLVQGAAVGVGEAGMVSSFASHRPVEDFEMVSAVVLGTLGGMSIRPLPRTTAIGPTRLLPEEQRKLFNYVNEAATYVPTEKMHYSEVVNEQFRPRFAGRYIFDTQQATRDIHQVRREFEAHLNAVDRGEIVLDPKGVPHKPGRMVEDGYRKTDPRDVNYENSAERYLKDIVNDQSIPQLVRDTATQILNSAQGALRRVGMTFSGRMRLPRTSGEYSWPSHEIRIKDPYSTLHKPGTKTANLVVHEALHALTSWKYYIGSMDIKAGRKTTLARLVKELDTLFDQASKVARKEGVFRRDPKTGDYTFGWDVTYAFDNPHELMAQMFSGSPEVLKYLNSLDSTKIPALRGSSKRLVGRLYDTIRRLLGLDLEDATVLSRGLTITQEFMDLPLDLKYSVEGGNLVHQGRIASPEGIARESSADVTSMYTVGYEASEAAAKGAGDTWQQRWGKRISWNLFKTVEKLDPEFARTWLSDPLRSNAGDNITSTRRAVRADFMDYQVKYYEAVREYMESHGIRPLHYLTRFLEVRKLQHRMELQLRDKLAEWDNLSHQGRDIPVEDTPIYRVAEAYDATMQRAARVGVDAGILPEEILGRRGYFRRRFDGAKVNTLEQKLADSFGGGEKGLTKARGFLADQLAEQFRGMDDIDFKTRRIYAQALLDRARRQDELQDLRFRGHMGNEIIDATADMLRRQGLGAREIKRVTDLLEGRVRESGKQSYQKGRIDLDMTGDLTLPDGTSIKVHDILHGNLTLSLQNYLDDLSGRVAMSRHGIPDTPSLDKIRQKFVAKAKTQQERQRAQELFDNIVNSTLGRPVGEVMPTLLRYVQAFTQMINLRASGFWQVTEYAPLMMRYGSLVGVNKMISEVFGSFTGMTKFFDQPENANHLGAILSRNTWNDLRWRPFIEKMDDGHAIDMNTGVGGAVYAQQYVYVLNGMRYIMRRQSVAAANLLLHSLEQASVKGTKNLRDFFGRYNIDDATLAQVRGEFQKHGWYVDKWDADVFNSIQPKLMTIIDEDVLRARLGEVPELAQFSSVGRVLSTFRSFIMTSHNKVLAGNLANDGVKAMAVIFAYQSMLSAMMVQIASVSGGRGVIDDPEAWATQAVSMMGGIGLFSEAWNIITGNSSQFGNPFMGAVDRAIGVSGNLASGEFGKALHGTVNAAPLISLIPGVGAALSLAFE